MIVTVRHLHDANALRSHGFDAPLVPGQEERANAIAKRLVAIAKRQGKTAVHVYHAPTLRARETATMIAAAASETFPAEAFGAKWLEELEQGVPLLPGSYRDGEYLPLLDRAWNEFCHETYERGNLAFRFGSGPATAGQFERVGQSLLHILPRFYGFLAALLNGELEKNGELLVLCSGSMTPLILCELTLLVGTEFPPEELPIRCWDAYVQHRGHGKGIATDVEFGGLLEFDLRSLRESAIPGKIAAARKIFTAQQAEKFPCLQAILDGASNDYSPEDSLFEAQTGKKLDATGVAGLRTFAPVSVVVPYFRDGAKVLRTLQAIAQQDLTGAEFGQVEVLIVDDGSHDDLNEIVRGCRFPFELRVLMNYRNRGRSYVRNLGARSAKHDILVFIDSDILLTRECLREHVLRNRICPGHIYNSLIHNVGELGELGQALDDGHGLPPPVRWNEYRTREEVKAGFLGIYDVPTDIVVQPLSETRNFRDFGCGKRLGPYDLPCMMATYAISMTRDVFDRVGGFSSEFLGWGMEDTYFGSLAISAGAKIIPVLSAGGYHVAHPPRSGSEEQKLAEFRRNIALYREMMGRPQ